MSRAHRRAIPPHLIERAWEVYLAHMTDTGAPPPDKLYWLGGFAAAIGVLIGSLEIGIPGGTPTNEVVNQIVNVELPKYQAELAHLEEQARKRNN